MDKTKQEVIDALNRIDEFASNYVVDNNETESGIGEAEQLENDYSIVMNFIESVVVEEVDE